jgi:hypothetical protein
MSQAREFAQETLDTIRKFREAARAIVDHRRHLQPGDGPLIELCEIAKADSDLIVSGRSQCETGKAGPVP